MVERETPVREGLQDVLDPIQLRVFGRVYWTGPDPEAVTWDLGRESRRARLYEIVLREGTLEDVRAFVNGSELVRLWDRLWLPVHLRKAWQPLIDAARPAA